MDFFNFFGASKAESQGDSAVPSSSPEADKAVPAQAASSQGASSSTSVASSSRGADKALPAQAASSQGASSSILHPISVFKNECVKVMFAWGSRDGEYSGYSENFYDLLESFITRGDDDYEDKAIEDFLCDEGISAYMEGYVYSETSVFSCDAANWLEVLALQSQVRIDYPAKLPNAWGELMKKYGDDEGAVTKVLQQRRSQLKRKQCDVIEEIQVSFIINYACI